MPLVFSPLSEDVLDSPPRSLLPKHAFLMRQIGDPAPVDLAMNDIVCEVLNAHNIRTIDAAGSTGAKDYLERILGLIRSTGFTVVIFSHETRPSALANIALELGFSAMCGKPVLLVMSAEAIPPSDLNRTDWNTYDAGNEPDFRDKLEQALDLLEELAEHQDILLGVALEAHSTDCAVAFERANKGFLLSGDELSGDELSGDERFIVGAQIILEKLAAAGPISEIGDLERLQFEIKVFLRQARRALP